MNDLKTGFHYFKETDTPSPSHTLSLAMQTSEHNVVLSTACRLSSNCILKTLWEID